MIVKIRFKQRKNPHKCVQKKKCVHAHINTHYYVAGVTLVGHYDQVSISSTFYEQLLRTKVLCTALSSYILALANAWKHFRTKNACVKRWWNWRQGILKRLSRLKFMTFRWLLSDFPFKIWKLSKQYNTK